MSSPFSNAENTDEFLECIKCYIRSLPFHISTYIPTGLLTPRDLYQRSTYIYGTYVYICTHDLMSCDQNAVWSFRAHWSDSSRPACRAAKVKNARVIRVL